MKRNSVFRRLLFDEEKEQKIAKMSQPGIQNFTRRVTRRQAQQKSTLLDNENSNLVTLGAKLAPASPLKNKKKPQIHESSPAKIQKPNKPAEKPTQVSFNLAKRNYKILKFFRNCFRRRFYEIRILAFYCFF